MDGPCQADRVQGFHEEKNIFVDKVKVPGDFTKAQAGILSATGA